MEEGHPEAASNPAMASIDGLNGGMVPQVSRFQARQDGHVERGGKRWVRRQDNCEFCLAFLFILLRSLPVQLNL